MKQCDCLGEINRQLNISKGSKEGFIVDYDLMSGKTLSRFEYKERCGKKERTKTTYVTHSFCPFCGEMYNNAAKPINAMLRPGKPDAGSYLCLPTQKNIPNPQHSDWKLVECPKCGNGCWISDEHWKLLKNNPGLKAVCTECALKAGVKEKGD